MASQENLVTLRCKQTGECYVTRVNRKRRNSYTDKDHKLSEMKYSKVLRKKALFEETKKLFKKK